MMKIIKYISSNVVIFAGVDLVLDQDGCRGTGWQFRNINPSDLTLEIVDSIPDQFVGAGWSYANGVWTSNEIANQEILPPKRSEKIGQFTELAAAENFSAIDYLGHSWNADQQTQALLAQVLAVQSVPEDMYWRDSLGVPQPVTYADLQGLGQAILLRGFDIDARLMQKKAELNAAATKEQIDGVVW